MRRSARDAVLDVDGVSAMPAKIHFHDLTEFRHLYWEGWPEARIARCFRVDRSVVRRIIIEQGLLPRGYLDANRFLADERGPTARRLYTTAATAARWKRRGG
jgi:hypothetical protein